MNTKINEKLCIFMTPDPKKEEGYKLKIIPHATKWYANSDDILLSTEEIELNVNIPCEQELLRMAIDTMQTKQKDIMAYAYDQKLELQAKIDKLNLLTYVPQKEA